MLQPLPPERQQPADAADGKHSAESHVRIKHWMVIKPQVFVLRCASGRIRRLCRAEHSPLGFP